MTAPSEEAAPAGGALHRFQEEDGFVGYRSPLLASIGIPHLFTTRLKGGRELDRGTGRGPAQDARVARAAGLPDARLVSVKQVHGARVLQLGPGALPEALPDANEEADGLLSERQDVLIGVHTADCVPVLLARPDGRRVAAVHAGWRGLVAGILPHASACFGPGPLWAAIGPCLSLERFEVGPEVVEAFGRADLSAAIDEPPEGRARIDLRSAAATQLERAGVERIEISDRCTYLHGEEFYSYRRDVTHGSQARTGRLAAWIAAIS